MKHVVITALLMVAVFIPQKSQAYGVIDTDITRLTPTLTMYTLEFEFGFVNADMWMPLAAGRSVQEGNTTHSLILSEAAIEDKKYFVPMKKAGRFTLLVLEEHAVGASKNSITVHELPVTLQREGQEKRLRTFTKEELKDFVVK